MTNKTALADCDEFSKLSLASLLGQGLTQTQQERFRLLSRICTPVLLGVPSADSQSLSSDRFPGKPRSL